MLLNFPIQFLILNLTGESLMVHDFLSGLKSTQGWLPISFSFLFRGLNLQTTKTFPVEEIAAL